MLTLPCNVDPLTPHFYIKNWGLQGYSFFHIFVLKHRLWVLVRTASVLTCTHNLCLEQNYENNKKTTENGHFYSLKKSQYISWACYRNSISLHVFALYTSSK